MLSRTWIYPGKALGIEQTVVRVAYFHGDESDFSIVYA